jgi:UDP-glucose 4-epimerase
LAEAHVLALAHLRKGGRSLAANLGTGDGYSVRQVIAAAETITGRRIPRREVERRAGDPPVLMADPTLARQMLGWVPMLSNLDEIIRTARAWHCRNVTAEARTTAAAGS